MMMSKAEETIKKAILLEHKGKAFYHAIAKNTASTAVREVFESMALEEEEHIRVLTAQLKSLAQAGSFKFMELREISDEISPKVLTQKVREQVSGAGYEAAAITAAMNFEKQAVDYYQSRARDTHDEEEVRIFTWLADWEQTHMALLAEIDRELQEKVWFDQSFWPIY